MTDSIAGLSGALESRYRVERELGEGGIAPVYQAEDLKPEWDDWSGWLEAGRQP